MKNENGLFLIFEECQTIVENSKLRFINENNEIVKSVSPKSKKIKILTKLQTLNDINANSRFYSTEAGSTIVNVLEPKSKNRCLFAELDHPIVDPETEIGKRRAVTPLITNSGALITEIKREGDDITAVIETLTGFRGPEFRDLIIEDKVNIGFSLRMFAKLKKHPKYQDVMEVTAPFRPITYDIVSSPSHNSARVIKLLTESNNLNDWINQNPNHKEEMMINESDDMKLIFESDHIGNVKSRNEFKEYVSDIIKKSFNNIRTVKFNL